MNILHILTGPGSGGAEVYVKDLAKSLASREHNVHIAFVGTAKELNRDLDYEKDFLKSLYQSGVQVHFIGNNSRFLPWKGIFKVNKYIRDYKIDVCHTHLAYGIIFSVLSKAPVVYTHHQHRARWPKLMYKLFNLIVDSYVGISEKCASALRDYTGGRKVNTIFNAVSIDKFDGYSFQRDYDKSKIVNISMVGRLSDQKDYENMLQALSLLPRNILNRINVLVAGEGDEEYTKNLTNLIKKNSLENNVYLCGNLTNIPEFLSKTDLFLMTSKYEGLPIALIEASISGLPCIVTDVGGCSEVISKSNNGIVVEPQNPKAIAEAITSLLESPDLLQDFSKNAVVNAYKYGIHLAVESHIELYKNLIALKN